MVEKYYSPGMYVECRSCASCDYTVRSDGRCTYCGSEFISIKALPNGMAINDRHLITVPGLEHLNVEKTDERVRSAESKEPREDVGDS